MSTKINDELFVQTIKNAVKIIKVPLNQFCYIVPIVIKLSLFIRIEYYYISDDYAYLNEPCYKNFVAHNMIQDDNLFYVTKKEFTNMITIDSEEKGSILYYISVHSAMYLPIINIIKSISFTVSHGIDEETFLKHDTFNQNVVDYHIFRAQSDVKSDMFNKIYAIDKTKKTILFEDTSFTFCHVLQENDHVLKKYQNMMFNHLIKLKSQYNVVIRFHPQYFEFLEHGHDPICKIIKDNFIVSYIQIPLLDQYNNADIIIFNRCTSSGYQSLLCLDKNMICIDMDLDSRKTAKLHGYWLIHERNNKYVEDRIANKRIMNNDIAIIGSEKDINICEIVENIEKNNYVIDEKMLDERQKFLQKNFDIDVKIDTNDENSLKFFLTYVLAQVSLHHETVTNLIKIMAMDISEIQLKKVIHCIETRTKNKFKI